MHGPVVHVGKLSWTAGHYDHVGMGYLVQLCVRDQREGASVGANSSGPFPNENGPGPWEPAENLVWPDGVKGCHMVEEQDGDLHDVSRFR
jgi:hypothetical protein